MATLYQRVRTVLARASELAAADGVWPAAVAVGDVPLERPRQGGVGDLASNLAFVQAKAAKQNPRALAQALVERVAAADAHGWIAAAEVAGPGFINLTLTDRAWQSAVTDVLAAGGDYGRPPRAGQGEAAPERILLEFVSANPTGPLHVGHGRGAVLGDALARLLRFAGREVATEYYINNVGNQVVKLGESVWHWLRDPVKRAAARAVWAEGEPVAFPDGFPAGFPEDGYRGAYIADLAERLANEGVPVPERWDEPSRADDRPLSVRAWQLMLERIRGDLEVLGISFDRWFSERALHGLDPGSTDAIAALVSRLAAHDWAYAQEGDAAGDEAEEGAAGKAVFFRGTREDVPKAFRDSKDRVILRSDGRPTYFAADIAYHDNKLARGFDHLVNILGADHHGYVPRLRGVLHALGDLRRAEGDPLAARWSGDRLEVVLVQMVSLLRAGKPVPMGKRSGEFVTLRDVIDEVSTDNPGSGRDAVRFLFLTRTADAQLEFDLEVARQSSMDNPVYYVQYGHARLANVLERAAEAGKALRPDASTAALATADERELAMTLAEFPEVVARAARAREPHQLAFWLLDTCRLVHGWYTRSKADARVISNDDGATQARLAVVAALKQTMANALAVLGVQAPERMATLAAAEETP